jgi:hypothetical protein
MLGDWSRRLEAATKDSSFEAGKEVGEVVMSGADAAELGGLLDRAGSELAVQPVTRADLIELLATFSPSLNAIGTSNRRLKFKAPSNKSVFVCSS